MSATKFVAAASISVSLSWISPAVTPALTVPLTKIHDEGICSSIATSL
jgi:hypothetical protein